MKKLVIELDEKFYKYVCEEVKSDELVYQAIQNGTPLSEELEKIKEEISCIYENDKTMWDGSVVYIQEAVIYEIIDNHIAELKGEDNE